MHMHIYIYVYKADSVDIRKPSWEALRRCKRMKLMIACSLSTNEGSSRTKPILWFTTVCFSKSNAQDRTS